MKTHLKVNPRSKFTLWSVMLLPIIAFVAFLGRVYLDYGTLDYGALGMLVKVDGVAMAAGLWLYYQKILMEQNVITKGHRERLFKSWFTSNLVLGAPLLLPELHAWLERVKFAQAAYDGFLFGIDVIALLGITVTLVITERRPKV